MEPNESAIKWLLNSADPSVRYFTLVDLLGAPDDSLEVQEARRNIPKDPRVQALLKGQRQDGSFGVSRTASGVGRTGGWCPWLNLGFCTVTPASKLLSRLCCSGLPGTNTSVKS